MPFNSLIEDCNTETKYNHFPLAILTTCFSPLQGITALITNAVITVPLNDVQIICAYYILRISLKSLTLVNILQIIDVTLYRCVCLLKYIYSVGQI